MKEREHKRNTHTAACLSLFLDIVPGHDRDFCVVSSKPSSQVSRPPTENPLLFHLLVCFMSVIEHGGRVLVSFHRPICSFDRSDVSSVWKTLICLDKDIHRFYDWHYFTKSEIFNFYPKILDQALLEWDILMCDILEFYNFKLHIHTSPHKYYANAHKHIHTHYICEILNNVHIG